MKIIMVLVSLIVGAAFAQTPVAVVTEPIVKAPVVKHVKKHAKKHVIHAKKKTEIKAEPIAPIK